MFQHPPRCFSSLSSSLKLQLQQQNFFPFSTAFYERNSSLSSERGGGKVSHVNLKPNMKLIANSFISPLIARFMLPKGEAVAAMFEWKRIP
jgi:hypothetical protein